MKIIKTGDFLLELENVQKELSLGNDVSFELEEFQIAFPNDKIKGVVCLQELFETRDDEWDALLVVYKPVYKIEITTDAISADEARDFARAIVDANNYFETIKNNFGEYCLIFDLFI